jgi:hypothetical protein
VLSIADVEEKRARDARTFVVLGTREKAHGVILDALEPSVEIALHDRVGVTSHGVRRLGG